MKNVKNILFSLIATVAITLLMTSCEQEALIDEVSGIENSLLDNDILKFNNIEAFIDYYEQLNMLFDEDDQEFNRVVEAISVNTVHKKLANDVFSNPDDRYKPFLIDPIMSAISNEHFEVQIADVLLTQITNDFILVSDVNDVATRSELRNMSKGKNLNINAIPAKAYPVTNDNVSTLLGPWSAAEYSRATTMDLMKATENRNDTGCATGPGDVYNFYDYGTFALECRTSTYDNWCCTYEFSKVISKKKSGSNWVNSKSKLYVEIHVERRDEYCLFEEFEYQGKSCNKCKDKSVRVNIWGHPGHEDYDIRGTYRKYLDWTTISHQASIVF